MAQDGVGEGGRTVREGGQTVREGGATVRDVGPTMRDDGATVREGDQTVPDPVPAARAREPDVAGWQLPPSLAADYRVVEPLPARGGEADLYVVESRDAADAARRVAKIYRPDFDLKENVLERVRRADPGHVVRVDAYGQDGKRWWELMEYVEQGSLRMLIEREGPRLPDSLIIDILRELNEALAGLHRLDMEHRDLKPGNVLVRRRSPLELVLTDFGISSVMDAAVHFTRVAQTIRYAPPEAIGRYVSKEDDRRSEVAVEHTAWDYWSLGMMLVEMLTGERPYAHVSEELVPNQLATQNVEYLCEGITDPNWRKLCRGLLRRTPSLRWDTQAVSKWIADPDDPDLDVADEAAPESSAALAQGAVIHFDGAAYSTPAELGMALSKDWEKAESFWKRRFPDVRTWLSDSLGLQALGDALAAFDDGDYSLDTQVFGFIYYLAPNAPLRFRNQDISIERIVALGERAVLDADDDAAEALLALYREQILTVAGLLPDQEELAAVSGRWDDAVQDYEELRQRLGAQGVTVPEPDYDKFVMLLAASIPDSPLEPLLRDLAWRACTEDAWCCDWFRERFGHPEEMSVAAMAMLPYVHAAAERRGKAARKRPRRALVGGIVVGALFGILGFWADTAGQGDGIYAPPALDDGATWGGVILLLLLILVTRVAVAWYRGSEGTGWERVLFGSEDDNWQDAVDFSWRTLLAHGAAEDEESR